MSDYRRGFGLDIGFIDHFNTRLVTTLNYSAIADFHTLIKSFPACSVFTSSCLVTAPTMTIPLLPRSSPVWMAAPFQAELKVTLQLAVYRLSFRLGPKTLEAHDQRFFQLNTCCSNTYVTFSLTRKWACLLWKCLAFVQVYISHLYHVS
jgi:hypothetical protein